LALLKFGVSVEVLKVWAVFGAVQLFEGAVLTPKIVGDSVGLHPVVVMLSLVVGANLFGFLGILLAVPVAAVLQVLLGTALGRYKDTSWFQQGQEEAPSVDEVP
jgi:predicted PurR-regulated permease PerM